MSNKLLIISYSFPPNNAPAAQRPYYFHKYLKTENYVLTSGNSISSLGISNWANVDNTRVFYTNDNKQKSSVDTFYSSAKNKKFLKTKILNEIVIPDRGIIWYREAIKKINSILNNDRTFTHVFSTSPSVVNHLIAWRVSKKYDLKWIADIRDYYYLDTISNSNYKFRKYIDAFIERRILKNADKLTFISDWMKNEYLLAYPFLTNKIETIYNGYDPTEYASDIGVIESKMTIFYAGSFYEGKRDPLHLLRLLDILNKQSEIDFENIKIRVAGKISDTLMNKLQQFDSFSCLEMLGILPRKEVLRLYKQSHILWLIIGKQLSHYTGFPIKGFEYIGSKRRILLSSRIPSEPQSVLSSLNNSHILDIEDIESKKNLTTLKNLYQCYKLGYLNEPIDYPNEKLVKYQRQYQAQQLDELIDKL